MTGWIPSVKEVPALSKRKKPEINIHGSPEYYYKSKEEYINSFPTIESTDEAIDKWHELEYRQYCDEYYRYINQYDCEDEWGIQDEQTI